MPVQPGDQIASRLRRIQSVLGVRADGVLGPETLTALESHFEIELPARATSLECSRMSLDLLVQFEVSSKSEYEKKYQRPIWPGGQSGVTIGIGYDLGMASRTEIESDWGGRVDDVDLASLVAVRGVTGPEAKKLAKSISHVVIPFSAAEDVFYNITLPRYARKTRGTYPGVQNLPHDAQGMMLSLIYNRGASLSGSRRKEMAAIKPLIQNDGDNLEAIAEQFESMERLWPDLPGLQKRRRREAAVIRAADREYEPDEIIRV